MTGAHARPLLALAPVLAIAAALGACQARLTNATEVVTPAATGSLAADDPDATVLANVDNARSAIALSEPMAALNDVNAALDEAMRLEDASPVLFGNGASGPGRHGGRGGAPPATAFDVLVQLTSVQGSLEAGDTAAADKGLAAVQAAAPAQRIPADLPLVRADESLLLAQIAIEAEHPAELKVQLTTAEDALAGYRGPGHLADARALAQTIGKALSRPGDLGALQPELLRSWSSRIDGWT